jgi:hypothetical protein
MTLDLLVAISAAAVLIAVVATLRAFEANRAMRTARCFRLRFARETSSDDVTVFLAGLSAIRPPAYLRWLHIPAVIFEVHASEGVIDHYLIVPRALLGPVLSQLRAALPALRVEPLEALPVVSSRFGREVATTATNRALRIDRAEAASAALLATLQPLREGEQVVVQWLVSPAAIPRPPRLPDKSKDERISDVLPASDGYELLPHAEALRAERAKLSEPLFACVGRIGVSAQESHRAHYLLGRVRGSYQLLTAPGVQLRRRYGLSARNIASRLQRRTVPSLEWPARLNAAELVGVLGWPLREGGALGVLTGAARQLPPSIDIPRTGCVIGMATYPGSERPIAISESDRRLHCMVIGPTGTGKTALLTSIVTQTMNAGHGVVVIEPKDLVTECLKRVPPERIKDVIVLDVGDDDYPVGFNLLDTTEAPAELVAENVVHVFLQLFGSTLLGPRSEDLLRASLLTGMSNPDFTLVDIPLLLSNAAWRRPYVDAVSDDSVGLGAFWTAFEALKPNDQAQVIAPLQNKLRQTILRKRVRYCIGQGDSKLKLRAALDEGKLLFVPLRKGLLGDTTASLMGSLVVARIWQTIQARASTPEHERRTVHLFIDEAADYMHLPTSIGDMLAQGRSLGLSVTVALQHLGQLLPELKQDLEVNCRSKILFQLNARDARTFEAELRPHLTAEDLQGLGRYEIVAQLAAGQRVAPPVTAVTFPPPPETHRAKSAIAWSRQHYGRKRSDVQAEMAWRHQLPAPTPIGRQARRAS